MSVISPVFDGSGFHTTRTSSGFVISIGPLVPNLKGCVSNPDLVTCYIFDCLKSIPSCFFFYAEILCKTIVLLPVYLSL
jgi:hypothetical protein